MQNEKLPTWLNDPPTFAIQNVDLGQHSATLCSDGRMAITGDTGSILLSSQETWKLLDLLYSQREGLYAKRES